jgi:hypothetical protein
MRQGDGAHVAMRLCVVCYMCWCGGFPGTAMRAAGEPSLAGRLVAGLVGRGADVLWAAGCDRHEICHGRRVWMRGEYKGWDKVW